MSESLQVVIEMTEKIRATFGRILEDVTAEEATWRPLPQANSINLIVRHLGVEAQWHRAALERGEPMPFETTDELQRAIDSVPSDLEHNVRVFEEAYSGFLEALREMTLAGVRQRTDAAYQGWPSVSRSAHFLGFHQAMHVSMHLGQISAIRNLYQNTRRQPARFFPDNPTFPKGEGG